jgi:hypothetical protein
MSPEAAANIFWILVGLGLLVACNLAGAPLVGLLTLFGCVGMAVIRP